MKKNKSRNQKGDNPPQGGEAFNWILLFLILSHESLFQLKQAQNNSKYINNFTNERQEVVDHNNIKCR